MAVPNKVPAPDARRDLAKELAAAGALKHQLGEAFGDDHDLDLLRDMIEGETNLDGAIDKVLEQMARDESNVLGIERFQQTEAARKKRLEDRRETMETMLLNVLDIVEERSIERPLALVYTRPKPAKVLIIDEAFIPTQFFKQPPPELSKRDLGDAIKDRRQTLEQKLKEVADAIEAGVITPEQAVEQRDRVIAAFPPIPGAELDNSGVSIIVKWS